MRQYKSPDDHQRPGQRIINYAKFERGLHEGSKLLSIPDELEIWLWNLSEKEFKKVMEWSPEK